MGKEERNCCVNKRVLFLAIAAAALPFAAEADAGTPLLWVGFHLFIGNLLIGIAEGLLLWRFLPSRRPGACIGLMIAANYFSAWLGVLTSGLWYHLFDGVGVKGFKTAVWYAVAVAWLFTIVAEFPFVWLAFRREEKTFKRALKASFVIQSASYIVLFFVYASFCKTDLLSVDVVDPAEISVPNGVSLSFVGEDGKGYVGDLRLRDWKETDADSIVSVATNNFEEGRWRHEAMVVGKHDVAWKVDVVWYAGCLEIRNEQLGIKFVVAIDTPFIARQICLATQLPEGKVVFQIGEGEICIADPVKKCIAVIAKGKYPVVTMDDDSESVIGKPAK